jgi:hypothetical protein
MAHGVQYRNLQDLLNTVPLVNIENRNCNAGQSVNILVLDEKFADLQELSPGSTL